MPRSAPPRPIGQRLRLEHSFSKKRNLIVTEYQPTNGQAFDTEVARSRDSTGVSPTLPEFGAEGRDPRVRYQFSAVPDT